MTPTDALSLCVNIYQCRPNGAQTGDSCDSCLHEAGQSGRAMAYPSWLTVPVVA